MAKTHDKSKQRKERSSARNRQDLDTLAKLQATLTETAEKIEDRRAAFFADPDDVETIHRFRTNTRTLRSLVAFIKPWQKAEQNAEVQALLKEAVGYTSLLRELDVFEKRVRTNPDASPELLAFYRDEAAAERARVLEALSTEPAAGRCERALSGAKHIVWKKRYAKQGLAASEVRARFDALVASVTSELAEVDLNDAERTHDVRKRAKRARYVAEFNGDILGPDAVSIAKGMKAQQDILGDVCDARANIRLIDGFLQRDLPESVAQELEQMRMQNETLLRETLDAAEAKK